MTNHPIAEQDSLDALLDELRWLKRVTEDDDTNVYGRTIDTLSQMRDALALSRAALADVRVGTIYHGDPDWYRMVDETIAAIDALNTTTKIEKE